MSRQAHLPDGTVLEFPDDTSDAVMDRVVKTHLGAPKAQAKPKDQSALNAFTLGAIKPIDNLAKMALQIPGIAQADKAVASLFGMPTGPQAIASNQAARANNARGGWQGVGNLVGTLPTLRLPGGPVVQGAASGALLSDRDNPWGIATDATIGGIAGKGSEMALNAMSYAAKPVVGKANQLLHDAGVLQTIGQIARGGKGWASKAVAGLEDAATSVPFLGDMIQGARFKGMEKFNEAIANRALKNVGETVPKGMEPGVEMVDFVGDRLSQKYQQLVPKLKGVFDKDFVTDLAAAKQATSILPDARQAQFGQIVKDVFKNRANGDQITGAELKDAESRLTTLIKKYAKSTDADQTIMADALSQVRDALRGTVLRNNPAQAKELQALNKGWAQLATYRGAANAPGNATGIVTPAQMLAASRKSGVRDDLTRAAKEILPSELPDSGTPRRALAALVGGGALGSQAFGPAAMAPAALGAAYTPAAQKLTNAFVFGQRPKSLQNTAELLNAFAKVAPSAVPALAAQRSK